MRETPLSAEGPPQTSPTRSGLAPLPPSCSSSPAAASSAFPGSRCPADDTGTAARGGAADARNPSGSGSGSGRGRDETSARRGGAPRRRRWRWCGGVGDGDGGGEARAPRGSGMAGAGMRGGESDHAGDAGVEWSGMCLPAMP